MTEITYTNIDGDTPINGTKNLDWTKRDGVPEDDFIYNKGVGGGYPYDDSDTSTEYPHGDGEASLPNNFDLVSPLALDSISIKTAPTKVSYSDGEALDLTGMVVEATYKGNHSGVSETRVITGYTTVPANGATLSTSDTEVTVSFGGKTATQAITVE